MAKIELSNNFFFGDGTGQTFSNDGFNVTRYGFIDRVAMGTRYDMLPFNYATLGLLTLNFLFIRIMQGTVPTDFSTLDSTSSRSSDILVEWMMNQENSNSGDETIIISSGSNPIRISTQFNNAIRSGTATWFWVFTTRASSIGTPTVSQFFGTVGTTGSGADALISSTNIVSGQPYKVEQILFDIPSSWTY